MLRILLVGGGTGGHIYPLVVVAQELKKIAQEKGIDLKLTIMAESDKWRSEFENLGVRFQKILTPKLRQVEGGRINFLAFLKIPITLIQTLWALFVLMPDIVFSKGGFVSLIPSLIAGLYFIPVYIHESDTIPGSVNRLVAKFAKKIFISFENSANFFPSRGGRNKKVILSGNPIRENLLNDNKNEAANYFNLNPDKKTILFLTGSQGAIFINNLVVVSLPRLVKEFQIIHQTGAQNFDSVKKETEKIVSEGLESYGKNLETDYRIYGFLSEEGLRNAYAMADVVVARAGSNIFEIAAVGRPAIVIPYPYSAHNHQKENAREFAKFGAVVLDEENLKPNILIDQIKHLIDNKNIESLKIRIKQFAKLDAGKVIASEILNNF